MRKFFAVVAVIAILSIAVLAFHKNEHKISPASSLSNGSGTNNSSSGNTTSSNTVYKDGTYTGSVANAYYGNIQVGVVIQGGKIVKVNFLQTINDNPTSTYINQQADPYLKQEAIQAQSAQVNIISGATFSSQAFIQSLSSALNQA